MIRAVVSTFVAILATTLALGCARSPGPEPLAVRPLVPGSGEKVGVQHVALLFDASSTIVEDGHFPAQKLAYRGFVDGMPEGRYEVEAVAFGGSARQRSALAPFARAGLVQHADGIRKLREGTPIDRVLAELQGSLSGKGERAAVVLFSDGVPSDLVGREVSPSAVLDEARALAKSYKGNVCFHGVHAGADPAGQAFLQEFSRVTSCGSVRSLASVSDAAGIGRLGRDVFLTGAPVARVVEAPKAAALPGDSDGDGVTDDADECPRTPRNARVDSRGCWTIPGLQFDTNSAALRPDARQRLDEDVLPVLKANPELRILIESHSDARGSDTYNQALSERRARSVMDYLVSEGVEAGRLESRGYGESKPIAPNDTPANLQKNRRIELTVL